MPSRTEVLDNLWTTTWQNMKSEAADNIFDATPFWFWLRANGQFDPQEGGRYIEEPLRYAKGDNVKWVRKGSSTALADKEFLTAAIYEWRYIADSIVRYGIDDQQNRGQHQIMSILEAKLNNSTDTLIDTLETALFTAQTGDAMNGLPDIVDTSPETGSPGGVNAATNSWWRNKENDFGGANYTDDMQTRFKALLNNCGNNLRQDTPDLILCDQTSYELYEEVALQYKELSNTTFAENGFEHQIYKGKPMLWSGAAPSATTYFLNSRFLRMRFDPAMFFDMTNWKDIPAQINDRVAQVITALNLVTSRRRVHGVAHNYALT